MDVTIGEPLIGTTANGSLRSDFGYWWKILTVNTDVNDATLPVAFALRPNAPNPFSTRTSITYAIPKSQAVPVLIGIYDLRGGLVKTLVREAKAAGVYTVVWDGRSDGGAYSGAGVYFAKFESGSFRATRKVVMLK